MARSTSGSSSTVNKMGLVAMVFLVLSLFGLGSDRRQADGALTLMQQNPQKRAGTEQRAKACANSTLPARHTRRTAATRLPGGARQQAAGSRDQRPGLRRLDT